MAGPATLPAQISPQTKTEMTSRRLPSVYDFTALRLREIGTRLSIVPSKLDSTGYHLSSNILVDHRGNLYARDAAGLGPARKFVTKRLHESEGENEIEALHTTKRGRGRPPAKRRRLTIWEERMATVSTTEAWLGRNESCPASVSYSI